MVKCEKCGKKAPDGLILCPHCGHRLKKPEAPKLPKVEKEPLVVETESNVQKPGPNEGPPEKTAKGEEEKPSPEEAEAGGTQLKDDETEKKPPTIIDTSSPYTKKPKTPTNMIILLIGILITVTVMAFFMSSMQYCQPDWHCGNWTPCENSSQRRGCVDLNECSTEDGKPKITRTCTMPQGTNETNNTSVTSNNSKNCSQMGDRCETESCCSGYCVHGICLETPTHCGDTYCDPGENCITCEHDCGKCQTERELKQNVFTEPLNYFNTTDYKESGYVIIRYFYNDMCSPCFYPDNFENELRDIAANYKDLVVLLLIDTFDYKEEAEKYAEFSGVVQTPAIVIEGIVNGEHDRTSLYSSYLSQKVEKYGVSGAVGREVCSHTDYCEWNGTIERNY